MPEECAVHQHKLSLIYIDLAPMLVEGYYPSMPFIHTTYPYYLSILLIHTMDTYYNAITVRFIMIFKHYYNPCKTTALLLLPLFLIACGGGGGGSSDGGSTGGGSDTVTMDIDTTYSVSEGDTVLPGDISARFDIEKKSDEDTSSVTLKIGSATIKRG